MFNKNWSFLLKHEKLSFLLQIDGSLSQKEAVTAHKRRKFSNIYSLIILTTETVSLSN